MNSANCLRTFGRRRPHVKATFHGGHRPGGSDCLAKTQDSAKSASRRRIGSDACPVLEGSEEECKLCIEAPVNGGRNYNGPKVAKFIVGEVQHCTNGVTHSQNGRQ